MNLLRPSSRRRIPQTSRWSRARGFTLVEAMVSLAVLVVASMGCVFSFMMLNQYASSLRNISSAKELCQERIEQARTMTFSPPATTPAVPGQDGKYYYILGMPTTASTVVPAGATTVPTAGTGSDYDSTGAFTGGSGATTLTEPVTVYAPRDGTTATAVTGTRTTTIASSPLTDVNLSTSLKLVQFTVTVTYTYRGQTYTYSMYTLRSPD